MSGALDLDAIEAQALALNSGAIGYFPIVLDPADTLALVAEVRRLRVEVEDWKTAWRER